MRPLLKKGVSFQPYAGATVVSQELAVTIFLRGQAGQSVVPTVVEKALQKEIVFERFGTLGHVTCRNVDIAQGLTNVLSRCNTICVRTQSLCQALMNLRNRLVGLSRSRMNLCHCVVEFLGELTLLNVRH